MRTFTRFMACLGIITAPLLYIPAAHANVGDDNFPIMAQGVPGAPVGGTTGDAGNGGVGDFDAGTDRTQSYDVPSGSSYTIGDQTRRHQPHHDANDANGVSDYDNPSGMNPDKDPYGNSGAGNAAPTSDSNTY